MFVCSNDSILNLGLVFVIFPWALNLDFSLHHIYTFPCTCLLTAAPFKPKISLSFFFSTSSSSCSSTSSQIPSFHHLKHLSISFLLSSPNSLLYPKQHHHHFLTLSVLWFFARRPSRSSRRPPWGFVGASSLSLTLMFPRFLLIPTLLQLQNRS